jgi:hypothetical protein
MNETECVAPQQRMNRHDNTSAKEQETQKQQQNEHALFAAVSFAVGFVLRTEAIAAACHNNKTA